MKKLIFIMCLIYLPFVAVGGVDEDFEDLGNEPKKTIMQKVIAVFQGMTISNWINYKKTKRAKNKAFKQMNRLVDSWLDDGLSGNAVDIELAGGKQSEIKIAGGKQLEIKIAVGKAPSKGNATEIKPARAEPSVAGNAVDIELAGGKAQSKNATEIKPARAEPSAAGNAVDTELAGGSVESLSPRGNVPARVESSASDNAVDTELAGGSVESLSPKGKQFTQEVMDYMKQVSEGFSLNSLEEDRAFIDRMNKQLEPDKRYYLIDSWDFLSLHSSLTDALSKEADSAKIKDIFKILLTPAIEAKNEELVAYKGALILLKLFKGDSKHNFLLEKHKVKVISAMYKVINDTMNKTADSCQRSFKKPGNAIDPELA